MRRVAVTVSTDRSSNVMPAERADGSGEDIRRRARLRQVPDTVSVPFSNFDPQVIRRSRSGRAVNVKVSRVIRRQAPRDGAEETTSRTGFHELDWLADDRESGRIHPSGHDFAYGRDPRRRVARPARDAPCRTCRYSRVHQRVRGILNEPRPTSPEADAR